jgi:hypothetical protein
MRRLALLLAVTASLAPAQQEPPRTVAEASGWTKTATHDEVLAFVRGLDGLPHGRRLCRTSMGASTEGRDLALVIAAEPRCEDAAAVLASRKLRVLGVANIHAGEVEGKEAVQILLREIAGGEHADLLEDAVLLFVPDFNPDGNDAMGPAAQNRRGQNGPDPVGRRHNASGLDLNRDFVKAASPEVRALLDAFCRFDPHVVMDLHTTNGSYHGYHLTYATSQSTNVDPELDRLTRETLLPEIRAAMLEHGGYRVFDYGNFGNRGERTWTTFDHRARYHTNYVGLRNRIAVLSEAYSHLPFEQRTAVTRAFVLATVTAVLHHGDEVRAVCDDADAELRDRHAVAFAYDTELAPPVPQEVLVGEVERVEAAGKPPVLVAKATFERVQMPTRLSFVSKSSIPLPAAWAIPEPPPDVVLLLQRHGLVLASCGAGACEVEAFAPVEVARRGNRFEGPAVLLIGELARRRVELPAGTLVVRADQPLGRLAAQLLEAVSEDGLATWDLFGDRVQGPAGAPGPCGLRYPVVRLLELPELGAWPPAAKD